MNGQEVGRSMKRLPMSGYKWWLARMVRGFAHMEFYAGKQHQVHGGGESWNSRRAVFGESTAVSCGPGGGGRSLFIVSCSELFG